MFKVFLDFEDGVNLLIVYKCVLSIFWIEEKKDKNYYSGEFNFDFFKMNEERLFYEVIFVLVVKL